MSFWPKEKLPRENGERVFMQIPEIISASRSTDIPAFYADWFFYRLKVGYSAWINPFNRVKGYVSYKNTRFIVFWSKNPRPLLKHLNELREKNIGCYVQYSLNDYGEGLEPGVHPLTERIETFKLLVEALGEGHVIWRFDPLILTDGVDIEILLKKIENIGDQLKGFTEKLVFSFADIHIYRRVKNNLEKEKIPYKEWSSTDMREFAAKLLELNKKWKYELATCAEDPGIGLKDFGIKPNHCIDDALMIRFAYEDKILMNALNVDINPMPQPDIFGNVMPLPAEAIVLPNGTYAIRGDNKDKGQRLFCGCMCSKDIGEYNTCVHLCKYCYANDTKGRAVVNYRQHKLHPMAESITGG